MIPLLQKHPLGSWQYILDTSFYIPLTVHFQMYIEVLPYTPPLLLEPDSLIKPGAPAA